MSLVEKSLIRNDLLSPFNFKPTKTNEKDAGNAIVNKLDKTA